MKIAVIDIGSNSIRYMEAELNGTEFGFSGKSVYTTRLASGLIQNGRLSEDSMQKSQAVLFMLAERARKKKIPCYCYATSAVRDAENKQDFLSCVLCESNLTINILTGEEEAAFARLGAEQITGGLIDIGGGSSQIITETYRNSFPLGCVRIRDLCGRCSIAEMKEKLLPVFEEVYRSLPPLPSLAWTAVGGTATTLAALSLDMTTYDAEQIKHAQLSKETLTVLLSRLDAMGDTARASHPLLIDRHDVIRGGGLILQYLMERIGINTIRFSDADGLEGYAMHLLTGLTKHSE